MRHQDVTYSALVARSLTWHSWPRHEVIFWELGGRTVVPVLNASRHLCSFLGNVSLAAGRECPALKGPWPGSIALEGISQMRNKRLPPPSQTRLSCCVQQWMCIVEEDPVVLQISGLGQGTGQLSTQKVILQSEGHGCPWRSGTLASGQAPP